MVGFIIVRMKNKQKLIFLLSSIGILSAAILGIVFWKKCQAYIRTWVEGRNKAVVEYIRNRESHRDWELEALSSCGDAPFLFPTKGFVGYLYNDSFTPLKLHTGLDIFGGQPVGYTEVYAPYDGYLTREENWKSSLIIRVPQDPFDSSRQIWVYMTHLADPLGNSLILSAFPAGTKEKLVKQGDLLGYQGNYSGYPDSPTGIHLHISIVKDDGMGKYKNELDIRNTIDPSPYFGMMLNADSAPKGAPVCYLESDS